MFLFPIPSKSVDPVGATRTLGATSSDASWWPRSAATAVCINRRLSLWYATMFCPTADARSPSPGLPDWTASLTQTLTSFRTTCSIVALIVGLAPWHGAIAADEPPRSSPAAKAAYTAAAALQNRGAWDLAADGWNTLLRDHPSDPLAAKGRYYLGLCRLQEGKWPEAAEAFRAVVESAGRPAGADPDTVGLARFELGRGAFAQAQERRTAEAYRDAAAVLQECLAAKPAPMQAAEASYLLAESLWQAGDRAAALEGWQRFITDHAASPRLPAVLYALGVAQSEIGDATTAAATLRRFAETFPDDPLADEVAIRRSDLALAADQPAEAAKLVVEIARRKEGPRIGDALERLGAALWKQKRYAAAAGAYDILLARDPGVVVAAPALLSASAAWSEAGNVDEARKRLEQLLALDGAPAALAAEGAARLARIHLASGDPEAAVAVAEAARARAEAAGPAAAAPEGKVEGSIVARLQLVAAEGLVDLPGRRDEGLALLTKLVAEHPDDPAVAPALALLSSVLLAAGKTDEAIGSADRFLALPPGNRGASAADLTTAFDVRVIRAEALLARGDAAAAAESFGALVASSGDDPRAVHLRLRLGAAHAAAEDWERAHAALGPLVAGGGAGLDGDERPLGLLLDATALVELARAKEAVVLLDRLGREHPTWPRQAEGQLLAMRARREAGDAAGAVTIGEQLVASAPVPAIADRAWFRLGKAREEAGDTSGAIAAFVEARRIAPQGPRVAPGLLAEGWCHEALGRLDEAVACWTEVIDHHPDSAALVPALLARGDARQRSGATLEGLADAERVGALAAADDGRVSAAAEAEGRFLAGLCQAASGQTAAAIDTLSALLAATPDFPAADRVLLELGTARSLCGDAAAAESTFEELRRRFPRSPRLADAWLESGEIRFAAADWDRAAEAYRNVLSATAESSGIAALREQARHKLAWIFAMQQDHAGAARAFEEQLAEHPDGVCAADAEAMLGDALFRLGRFDEAERVLGRALAKPEALSSPDLLGLATVRAAECAAKGERFEESFAAVDRWLGATPGPEAGSATVAQGRFARAWALQNLGRLDEALSEFRAIADAGLAPGTGGGPGELAARARLMEGEILFEQGLHKEAIASFFKVAYGFGETEAPASFHPWQAQATFEAARCFEVLAKPQQARGLYAEVVERYPESPYVMTARKRIDALDGAVK